MAKRINVKSLFSVNVPVNNLSAEGFIAKLSALASKGIDNSRHSKGEDTSSKFMDVRMADIFTLAKQFVQMMPPETGKLLDSDFTRQGWEL